MDKVNEKTSFYKKVMAATVNASLYYPNPDGTNVKYDSVQGTRPIKTTITNARINHPPCILHHGFELFNINDLELNFDAINLSDFAEKVSSYLMRITNKDRCLVLGCVQRNTNASKQLKDFSDTRPPVFVPHTDWTAKRIENLFNKADANMCTRPTLTEDELFHFLKNNPNFELYNLWFPLNLVLSYPLALCSIESVSVENIRNMIFDNGIDKEVLYSLKQSDEYRWYYYPLMQKGEVLIFKQWDNTIKNYMPVFHTAFELPGIDPKSLYPRRNIEYRILVA